MSTTLSIAIAAVFLLAAAFPRAAQLACAVLLLAFVLGSVLVFAMPARRRGTPRA